MNIVNRFRGFLPVVVDVETGGVNPQTDALLEIAAVMITMDEAGYLHCGETYAEHVAPFEGGHLNPEALEFNKIDPHHPFRFALPEKDALEKILSPIHAAINEHQCKRAVLVGHNAWFDLLFLKSAILRCKIQNNPFHAFTAFDTASLSALAFGQTVLARAAKAAKIEFNRDEAHSAVYDAERTAELFCHIVNQWHDLSKRAL